MLTALLQLLGLAPKVIPSPLNGLVLQPFENNPEEPYATLSRGMQSELTRRGVLFDPAAEMKCELDWEMLAGSHLRLKLAARIGTHLVDTTVREGWPMREVVDFDIEVTSRMHEDKKAILFFQRGAEKLVERLEHRYAHDLR